MCTSIQNWTSNIYITEFYNTQLIIAESSDIHIHKLGWDQSRYLPTSTNVIIEVKGKAQWMIDGTGWVGSMNYLPKATKPDYTHPNTHHEYHIQLKKICMHFNPGRLPEIWSLTPWSVNTSNSHAKGQEDWKISTFFTMQPSHRTKEWNTSESSYRPP